MWQMTNVWFRGDDILPLCCSYATLFYFLELKKSKQFVILVARNITETKVLLTVKTSNSFSFHVADDKRLV
jgi:hypothetical protein